MDCQILDVPRNALSRAPAASVARADAQQLPFSEPDHGSHIVSTSELEVFDRLKPVKDETFDTRRTPNSP